MTPGTYPLCLYRGDSHAWRFVLWADYEQTVPIDLTGATVAAEIRDRSAGATIIELDCTVSVPNTIDVELAPEDSRDCPSSAVWDLEIIYTDGAVHTVVAGPVRTGGDVTNSTVTT